jgi:hypothetical protein
MARGAGSLRPRGPSVPGTRTRAGILAGVTQRLVFGSAVVVLASVAAVLLLDPILAAALVIVLVTALGAAIAARDWDSHPTYEEREQARALRRKAKWERTQGSRDRDRARWEAHQARKAAGQGDS